MATLPVKSSVPWGRRASELAAAALVVAALGWAYAPCFANLVGLWNADPNNTYGYLVIPIALAILWERRGLIDRDTLAPSWWGFLPLAAVLVVRAFLFERNEKYLETATIPVVVGGLALVLGGGRLLWATLPAILFLFFMLPLPPSINYLLAGPLQRLATSGSIALLQLIGLPVFAEGNVITVGADPLEVARACNGLSMLLSFVTLITAVVLLVRRPLWEKVVLMASAVPIALISNIIRITATAWCYYHIGRDFGDKIAHDAAGIAMMVIALILVGIELRVLSWLFVAVEVPSLGVARNAPRTNSGS